MDGPRNPHDILDVRGEKELQKYLVFLDQFHWPVLKSHAEQNGIRAR
jgi:hypothetical protein